MVTFEEPIPSGAVISLVNVFSSEVEDILGIPVVSTSFVAVADDGIRNYTTMTHVRRDYSIGGPVQVPIAFLTGWGWDSAKSSAVRGRGALGPRYTSLFASHMETGIEFYADIVACCSDTQLRVLLHEFGHNLGLPDLYEIEECKSLPVLMSYGPPIPQASLPPTGKLLFRFWDLNETSPSDLVVRDTYFDRALNNLTWSFTTYASVGDRLSAVAFQNQSFDFDGFRLGFTLQEIRYLGVRGVPPDFAVSSCPVEVLG